MKNTALSLLLLSVIPAIEAKDKVGEVAIGLVQTGMELSTMQNDQPLPSEKNLRRDLYWKDKYNPYYYLLDGFSFDYYIPVLKNHQKVLEGKIALGENGLHSKGMISGLLLSTLSAITCYAAYAAYVKNGVFAAMDKPGKAQEWITNSMLFGAFSTLFAAAAGKKFYKVSRYAERLVERLERDKRILAVLEKEKAHFDSKKQKDSISGAVDTLVTGFTNALNNAVQSFTHPYINNENVPVDN